MHLGYDFGMQGYAHLVDADCFDRLVELNVTPGNRRTGGGRRLGDVAGRNGAIELPALACLAEYDEALAVERFGCTAGILPTFGVARLENCPIPLELFPVGLARPQRLPLGQEEISRITIPYPHDFSHRAELFHPFQKNDFHAGFSFH